MFVLCLEEIIYLLLHNLYDCTFNEKNKKGSDNKTFWNTVKTLLSDKVTSTQKITLIEKEEIIMGDHNTVKILSCNFFSNTVIRLKNILPRSIFYLGPKIWDIVPL